MIKKFDYNPTNKSITIHTDDQTYPVYTCYTQNALCSAIDKFDTRLSNELSQAHMSLQEFITNFIPQFNADQDNIDYMNDIYVHECLINQE